MQRVRYMLVYAAVVGSECHICSKYAAIYVGNVVGWPAATPFRKQFLPFYVWWGQQTVWSFFIQTGRSLSSMFPDCPCKPWPQNQTFTAEKERWASKEYAPLLELCVDWQCNIELLWIRMKEYRWVLCRWLFTGRLHSMDVVYAVYAVCVVHAVYAVCTIHVIHVA